MNKITKVMNIQKQQDYHDGSICRVHTSLIREKALKRNAWIKIINNENSKSIYRRAKGGSPRNSSKEYIELDYDSMIELEKKYENKDVTNVDFEVKQANFVEIFLANWNYPNYTIMIAFRIAVLSLFLGIVGVLK